MAIQMTRQTTRKITRRDFAALAGGFLVSTSAVAETETPLLTRAIPSSGERIPSAPPMFSMRITKRREARPMQSYRLWSRMADG